MKAVAHSALVQAQANLMAARARLSYTDLLAPFNCQVVSRNVEPGDTVQPGKVLLVLAPDGVTELVSQIDERNLSLLKPGLQPMRMPSKKLKAEISSIAPGVNVQRGAVQVKLKVDVPPDYLRQDMTVSVEIEVARKDAALAVPIEAVHDADAAKPWLWTVDEQQRTRHTPVVLGLRGATRVEVVAGLSAGAQVVTVPAPTLVAGQRVRVARL